MSFFMQELVILGQDIIFLFTAFILACGFVCGYLNPAQEVEVE